MRKKKLESYLEPNTSVLQSKTPSSVNEMKNVMKSFLLKEDLENKEFDDKILLFKNALQAKKIVKEKDSYFLYLPNIKTKDDNCIVLSLKNGFIEISLLEEDEFDINKGLNLDHLYGDVVIPYVQNCMVPIYAKNAKALFLPDLLNVWEINTGARIFHAPKLQEIDWNCSLQNVKECDLRSLEVVNGIMSFPSVKDISSSFFIFPDSPIEIKGIAFKKIQDSFNSFSENERVLIFKEMAAFFEFQENSDQLQITPNEEYLFLTGHNFFGVCGTPICIRASNRIFWKQASRFGEVAENLSIYVFKPLEEGIQAASLVFDLNPEVYLGAIHSKKNIQNETLVPKVKAIFRLASLLALEKDTHTENYKKLHSAFNRISKELQIKRDK
jgi:hypothetical protein